MAYAEADRVLIRRFLGVGAIFLQVWPLVESAITATQSVADGGARPDSSTENEIKGILYGVAAVVGTNGVTPGGVATSATFSTPAVRGLIQIEAQIAQQDVFLGAQSADKGEVVIDPARETARLRGEGDRLCKKLARMLGMRRVISHVFFPGGDDDLDTTAEEIFLHAEDW